MPKLLKPILRVVLLLTFFLMTPFTHMVYARAIKDGLARTNPSAARQSATPVINIWYGNTQTFGTRGWPQDRINILGNLTNSSGYRLEYKINDSTYRALTLGQASGGNERLGHVGDFNVELFDPLYFAGQNNYTVDSSLLLRPGANTLTLRVMDVDTENEVTAARKTVTINYTPMGNPPWVMPYSINWDAAGSINSVAQIVDGKWHLTAEGARTSEPGYDRVIAIGDTRWDDYQVSTRFKVHNDPGGEGGVGVILGWQGHVRNASETPLMGWYQMGAYGYLSFRLNNSITIRTDGSEPPTSARKALAGFAPNTWYNLRMQAETQPGDANNTIYRIKIWPAGSTEPAEWDVERTDVDDLRPTGSLLLVAHLVDVTFDDVSVSPLGDACHSLAINSIGAGSVSTLPDKDCYAPGDVVQLTANPATGWSLLTWEGDVSGTTPVTNLTIQGNTSVRAVFYEPGKLTEPVYIPAVQR